MKNSLKKGFLVFITMFCSGIIFSQDVSINGKIIDENGLPVPGASILIKGTTKATSSDMDGNFQLKADPNGTLVISFVGYATIQEAIKGRNTINAKLNPESQSLQEVVVVGYGTQKKGLITGASSNFKGEDLASLNTGSAMDALQGIAAGVNISKNNGAPGAGTRVTIRGLGTIGNSNPLYIVDGVSVGSIDYLNSTIFGLSFFLFLYQLVLFCLA